LAIVQFQPKSAIWVGISDKNQQLNSADRQANILLEIMLDKVLLRITIWHVLGLFLSYW
jgi:hypothetical protein